MRGVCACCCCGRYAVPLHLLFSGCSSFCYLLRFAALFLYTAKPSADTGTLSPFLHAIACVFCTGLADFIAPLTCAAGTEGFGVLCFEDAIPFLPHLLPGILPQDLCGFHGELHAFSFSRPHKFTSATICPTTHSYPLLRLQHFFAGTCLGFWPSRSSPSCYLLSCGDRVSSLLRVYYLLCRILILHLY